MPDTDTPIDMIPGRHQVRRAADAMLRALGGEQITLRVADPSTATRNSQLGITPPTASDIQIAPAVVQPSPRGGRHAAHPGNAGREGLQPIADSYGVTNIPAWLLGSQGLVYRGQLMPIKSVTSICFAGGEYLYLLIATE